MSTLETVNLGVVLDPLFLSAEWSQNGVRGGIEIDYRFALKHRHFYDGGECFHEFSEVDLWQLLRKLGVQNSQSDWQALVELFQDGRANEVDSWIEANCKTLASFYF